MGAEPVNCNLSASEAQINPQPAALQTNSTADIRAAAADADIGIHRWLNRFAIRTAPGQNRSDRDQKQHTHDLHYTSAFHRLIWART